MANSHTLGTGYSPRMWWADIEVPNSAVDVNSWAESACYPQSTFIRWAMALPYRTTGSLWPVCCTCSTCVVSAVKPPLPLHYQYDVRPYLEDLRTPPLPFGGDRPSQTAYHARVPWSRWWTQVRTSTTPGWDFKDGSQNQRPGLSAPTHPAQVPSKSNAKLQ